ncbi:ComEC/Rec2-related protein [Gloeomargarita lithophora Alchichica-D10]|uniref:ComEC/Rec2-related protein n=1 Tax=Gloeomargarita lithophora Alchichica-D10 TaxID=1188229 RepID=A0A1J0AD01_9CYAN|nr:ComEC/Rec2 family competence protein [Gloeomargarita lithophora]APB33822.1 ComEC/Rec2-related protein [Gloeomargarita lithophora Alchichica-D10]
MGKRFNAAVVVVLSSAWVLGLLAALVPYRLGGISLGGVALAGLAGVLAGVALRLPRLRRWGLGWWVWLMAGLIVVAAGFYLQWRTPQPGPQDISRKAPEFDVVVTGKALNLPRLNSSGKRRFFLETQQIELGEAPYTRTERVTGNLYVTVAPEQAEGVTPGRQVSVKGDIYLPVTAAFRGGFDFKNYLAQNNTFAGLRGEEVYFTDPTGTGTWGFWQLRQRIVAVHRQALGEQRGPLVSAMVVGARVVDLDASLRTAFTRAGLAHTIAASGFHVSLLLGTVLALTNRLGLRTQMLAGLGALGLFVMLAGFEAGVARASLMGSVGLWGLVQTGEGDVTGKRQPLHLLLLVAAVLLLYNPTWIGTLGFQFSFLATLGLMLLANPIAQSLTFLPPALAELIAVPTAAYLWTLPLQLYSFGLINTYAILLNAVAAPLITVLTLGGMVTAVIGLIQFQAGVGVAALLTYPLDFLLAIVAWTNQLPFNSLAAGKITAGQMVLIYVLLGLVCSGWDWWRRRWLWVSLFAVTTVLIPLVYGQATRLQLTVLETGKIPVMVLENRGKIGVINAGDEKTVKFTLLPFLQLQGVNQIDVGIALPGVPNEGWTNLNAVMPLRQFYGELPKTPLAKITPQPLDALQNVSLGEMNLTISNTKPTLLRVSAGNESLVWVPESSFAEQDALVTQGLLPANVLWWSGGTLGNRLLQTLQPYGAIASNFRVKKGDMGRLERLQISTFVTGQAGAVQWRPRRGFAGGRQESAG